MRDRDHDRMRDDDDGVICRKRQYFNGPNPDLRCGSVNENRRLRRRSGNKENVDEDMMS